MWSEARIQISQYIWGEGYCGPGGPEHIIGISKLMALSPEMSMMVLGAGLGGPARVLAHEFGAWVTGYESSEQLAAAGMELSTKHGMAKKAPIQHYNPDLTDPFDRNFDRAFIKDTLFTVANKPDLMRKVNNKLKEVDSLILVTDYVMGSATFRDKPEYARWKEQEPLPPYLYTHDEETELFENTGYVVRVNEDISEYYASLITKAWADVDAAVSGLMKKGEEGKKLIKALLHEAEFWSLRAKLLESGDLQMWRILASKKASKTLSNW
jgi:cyclopropane fatty-acyl-phospholipid synthase-like methyltransferase